MSTSNILILNSDEVLKIDYDNPFNERNITYCKFNDAKIVASYVLPFQFFDEEFQMRTRNEFIVLNGRYGFFVLEKDYNKTTSNSASFFSMFFDSYSSSLSIDQLVLLFTDDNADILFISYDERHTEVRKNELLIKDRANKDYIRFNIIAGLPSLISNAFIINENYVLVADNYNNYALILYNVVYDYALQEATFIEVDRYSLSSTSETIGLQMTYDYDSDLLFATWYDTNMTSDNFRMYVFNINYISNSLNYLYNFVLYKNSPFNQELYDIVLNKNDDIIDFSVISYANSKTSGVNDLSWRKFSLPFKKTSSGFEFGLPRLVDEEEIKQLNFLTLSPEKTLYGRNLSFNKEISKYAFENIIFDGTYKYSVIKTKKLKDSN